MTGLDRDARLADLRARADAAPLGRYRAGQDAARRAQARAAIADVADGVTLTHILAAVVRGDEDAARGMLAELAERDADLVSSIREHAERLAVLAEQAGSGVR